MAKRNNALLFERHIIFKIHYNIAEFSFNTPTATITNTKGSEKFKTTRL